MSRLSMSLYEIRMAGWKALTDRLGPAGAMRFMMQYDPGYGDYSKERHELFGALTLDELAESMTGTRPDGDGPRSSERRGDIRTDR